MKFLQIAALFLFGFTQSFCQTEFTWESFIESMDSNGISNQRVIDSIPFNYFNDSLVVRTTFYGTDTQTIDTSYSCNFDNHGNIISESKGRFIFFYNKSSSGKIHECIFLQYIPISSYPFTISKSIYFYNNRDSIIKIINYNCHSNYKLPNLNAIPKKSYKDLESCLEYTYSDSIIYIRNKRNLTVLANLYNKDGISLTWSFEHDNTGKIIEQTRCEFGYKGDPKNGYSTDTTYCQFFERKHFNYGENITTAIDTMRAGAGITYKTTQYFYSPKNKLIKELTTVKSFDHSTSIPEIYEDNVSTRVYDDFGRLVESLIEGMEYMPNSGTKYTYKVITNE